MKMPAKSAISCQSKPVQSEGSNELEISNRAGRWISLGRTTMMWLRNARNDHESQEEATRVTRLSTISVGSVCGFAVTEHLTATRSL
jgi:hypothetical protein